MVGYIVQAGVPLIDANELLNFHCMALFSMDWTWIHGSPANGYSPLSTIIEAPGKKTSHLVL